jgi:Fe-S cluster assembly iron-binding protein IscA
MALDEPKEADEVFENDGVNYIIDKKLHEMIKPVYVDYITGGMGSGFVISSNPSAAGSCSSCGGSCT